MIWRKKDRVVGSPQLYLANRFGHFKMNFRGGMGIGCVTFQCNMPLAVEKGSILNLLDHFLASGYQIFKNLQLKTRQQL